MALWGLCSPESMPSICLVYGLAVALGGLRRLASISAFCFLLSNLPDSFPTCPVRGHTEKLIGNLALPTGHGSAILSSPMSAVATKHTNARGGARAAVPLA